MTSQLNVDTIVDKAGSGGTNVKIANNSVTVAEGGSATTTTVQGLCKVWINLNGTSTINNNDSFNVSGITDNGTGDYTITISNDMNNAAYVIGSHTQRSASVTENSYCSSYQNNYDNAHNTGFFRVSTNRPDNADDEDALSVQLSVQGDLA